MKKVFFIADTHFGHKNIINYEMRPFKDIDEMDEVLINNWNRVVSPEDNVFLLGDFSFYDKERSTEICKQLNGVKTLISGNHDERSIKFYMDCGFDFVSKYPIIYDDFWILSHKPLYVNTNMPYANIFGHVHGSKIYIDHSSQSYCVSAERINYTPIGFDEIKNKVEADNND